MSAYQNHQLSTQLADLLKMKDSLRWRDNYGDDYDYQDKSLDIDYVVRKNDELVSLLIESASINVDNGFQAMMSSGLREWFIQTREEAIIVGLQNDITALGELLREGSDKNKSMEDMIQEVKMVNEDFSLYYIVVAALGGQLNDVEDAAREFYHQFEDKLNKQFLEKLLDSGD